VYLIDDSCFWILWLPVPTLPLASICTYFVL
jgi:hypothetical protein